MAAASRASRWDFGDGISDSGATVTHTYSAAGRYRRADSHRQRRCHEHSAQDCQHRRQCVAHRLVQVRLQRTPVHLRRIRLVGLRGADRELPLDLRGWAHQRVVYRESDDNPHRPDRHVLRDAHRQRWRCHRQADRSLTVVNALPIATFTSTCTGLTCALNASASSDANGEIRDFAWQFGNVTTVLVRRS